MRWSPYGSYSRRCCLCCDPTQGAFRQRTRERVAPDSHSVARFIGIPSLRENRGLRFVVLHKSVRHGAAVRACPHSRRVLEGKRTNYRHCTFGADDLRREQPHIAPPMSRMNCAGSLALKGTNLPASDVEGSTNRDWVGRRRHAQKPCR